MIAEKYVFQYETMANSVKVASMALDRGRTMTPKMRSWPQPSISPLPQDQVTGFGKRTS